jgi:hypothetical protein
MCTRCAAIPSISMSIWPASSATMAGLFAAKRDMGDLDAGERLEQLRGKVGRTPDPARPERELSGVRLQHGHPFGQSLCGNRRIDDGDQRIFADERYADEIADTVIGKLLVDIGERCLRGPLEQQRIAVGLGLRDRDGRRFEPPAPTTFSTTTRCPSCSERRSARIRAMTSMLPPAASGTISRILPSGNFAATSALACDPRATSRMHAKIRNMSDLPWSFLAQPCLPAAASVRLLNACLNKS